MLSQQEYMVLQQPVRYLHIRIEILNENDRVIDSIEGYSISGGLNFDGNSTYRRTGDLEMIIINQSNVLPANDSNIWFNRKVRIKIGLKNFNDEIIWFNQGIFLIQDADLDLSKDQKTISISLTDLVANLDGTFKGTLSNEVKIINSGVTVSEAIKSTVIQLGKVLINDVRVNGSSATVPFTIEKSPNSSIYDLAKELVDLYMGYEMFFDKNGRFIVRKIKDGKNDPIVWDFSEMDVTINCIKNIDFSNVKNSIYVWGRKNEDGTQTKWVYRNKYSRQTISDRDSINDMVHGDICHVLDNGASYMWDDTLTTPTWVELDFNVVPDFNIESIGERKFVYDDSKIFNDNQARLRAEYELKQKSNFAETVSFNCLPLYGLEVNQKIYLKENSIGIDGDYLIKRISMPLSINGQMSIEATKIHY